MSNRMLALATGLMLASPVAAVPGFAQQQPAPAAPMPAAPSTQAPAAAPMPSTAAPATAAPAAHATPHHATAQHASRTESVMRLQEALNHHGAKLKVDGKMGPHTRAALESFQRSRKLKVTGHPDKETIAALRA
jgi:peptidoglycan hydrolase-like protein with peptidoglycan-binding domain